MDTDYLSKEAYEVLISKSRNISEYLTPEIGAMASENNNEDDYIKNVIEFLQEICDEPEEYLDDWNILDSTDINDFVIKIKKLIKQLKNILSISYSKRDFEEI
jgi:hypothetical protein